MKKKTARTRTRTKDLKTKRKGRVMGVGFEKSRGFLVGEIGEIPRVAGVYLMIGAAGRVIYVGKAVNLRARVRQYFALGGGGDDRVSVPLIRRDVTRIEVVVTENEKEAFLLENSLIKRHRPKYNVRLRDDKTYVSVRVDLGEEWPRAVVTRRRGGAEKKKKKKGKGRVLYFGPYTNTGAIRASLRLLQRVFPLCSCGEGRRRNRGGRACMLSQIGRCCAPCEGKVSREVYEEYVQGTILFLKGRGGDLVEGLRAEMLEASEALEFERAAELRDRIGALEVSLESPKFLSEGGEGEGVFDVVGFVEERGVGAFSVMRYRGGEMAESGSWVSGVYGLGEGEALGQFLGQYFGEERLSAASVLLSRAPEGGGAVVEEWLGDLRGGRVRLAVPLRGEKRRLVRVAEKNAGEALARRLSGAEEAEGVLGDLARRLKLDHAPERIECYDIATLQGSMSAGSQVVFVDGEPEKGEYRLYRIREVEGIDDFAMMREVLGRRFRSLAEKGGEGAPDLVLVDGGKGQLSAAVEALEEWGLGESVAVAALVKSHLRSGKWRGKRGAEDLEGGGEESGENGGGDVGGEGRVSSSSSSSPSSASSRTPEMVFVPGRKNPVSFPPRAASFYLLQRLRDEAHRFVNSYHGKLRRRSNLRSSLEDIPGVGKGRARTLLRHFGSLAGVRRASLEELEGVRGVPEAVAREIFEGMKGER